MQFTVTDAEGRSVKVESPNWVMAMGKALAFFEEDPEAMGRWICVPERLGEIHIDDPVSGASWVVKRERSAVEVVAVGPEGAPEPEPAPAADEDPGDPPYDPERPPPLLHMPGSSLVPPEEPLFSEDDLAERLFDLSTELVGQAPDEACHTALDLILEAVPAEAGSVLRGGLEDLALVFVAVHGPAAGDLEGREVPFGEGLVGVCFDLALPIQVADLASGDRHLTRLDDQFDFEPRDALCVPISNEEGTFGVIELVNLEREVTEPDVQTVQTIAATLANSLGAR